MNLTHNVVGITSFIVVLRLIGLMCVRYSWVF